MVAATTPALKTKKIKPRPRRGTGRVQPRHNDIGPGEQAAPDGPARILGMARPEHQQAAPWFRGKAKRKRGRLGLDAPAIKPGQDCLRGGAIFLGVSDRHANIGHEQLP
jgi:hypothetical protein